MSTTRTFNGMLLEHMPYDLLKEEMIKRDFVLQKVSWDNNWKGGSLDVPFRGARASSVSYGSLTAADNVTEYAFVKGQVTSQKEVWGTMKWNARDLMEHDSVDGQKKGVVSEQSFLKNLPDLLEDFMDSMKEKVSIGLLTGRHMATLTADANANDGNMTVDRPEYFDIGQKVIVDDDNTAAQTMYVKTINVNTGVINCVTTLGGATVFDFSGATMETAQNARVYLDGAQTAANAFTTMAQQLLPYGTGVGTETLFGQTKTDYPYLQAKAISGAGWTSSTLLDDIFDAVVATRKTGKGNPTHVIMSYTNLAYVLKLLEISSGAYKHQGTKANLYGWTEVTVMGIKGEMTLVAVNEMSDTEMFIIDWRGWKLHSNGGFRVQKDPEGKMYFTVRETTGYYYLVDCCFFGELVCNRPSHQGVVYSISL